MPPQGKTLWVGGAGAACTSPLDDPERGRSAAGGNGSVTPRHPLPCFGIYLSGSALQSHDAEEQEQRNCRYVSASCRSRTSTAQLGKLQIYGASGWPRFGML